MLSMSISWPCGLGSFVSTSRVDTFDVAEACYCMGIKTEFSVYS